MTERPPCPGAVCRDPTCPEAACLRRQLVAERKTVGVLMDRLERPTPASDADRFALRKSISTLQDIARQQEEQVRHRSLEYEALVAAIPDAILTIDGELVVLQANPAALRLLGGDERPVEGLDLTKLFGESSAAALTSLLWSGFSGVGESLLELEDGRRLGLSVARLPGARVLLVLRDVTRAHQQEQELRRSRRLASAGRLASALVRDITTPTSIIQGHNSLLLSLADRTDRESSAVIRRHAGIALTHARRIGTVIRNLQTFVAPQPMAPQLNAMGDVTADAMAELGSSVEPVLLDVAVEPKTLEVWGDRAQLSQALSNLLGHVVDRSPAGDRLRLCARESVEVSGAVEVTLEASRETLPPAVLAELRSPYAEGERQFDPDVGMGLAIAWAIVQDHGGWLTVEEREQGVTFRLLLPGPPTGGSGESREAGDGDDRSPTTGPAPGLILVVDDDQLLRETVSWMLEDRGHTIATTATAEDALAWMEHHVPDAVLVDIGLPGMRGDALVEAIAERWPALASRTVVTSGLLHAPRQGEAYLQKPFTRAQLLGTLERILAG